MRRALVLSVITLLASACDKEEGPDPEETAKRVVDEAMKEQLDALKQERDGMAKSQEALQKAVDAQKEMLASLEGTLSRVEASHAKLEEKVAKLEEPPPPPEPATDPTAPVGEVYKVTLGDAQTRGNDSALITIVQWSDFECPHCAYVGSTLELLEAKYGSDVRFAFMHFPLTFHTNSRDAAIAAEAAGEQGKFWEMHDLLFDNMRDLSDKNYVKWARELKLDVKQFKKDLADPDIAKRVDDMKAQGEALGLAGTPTFFVNGRQVEGGNSAPEFIALIDEELTRARALVASGVSPSKVYEEAIKEGIPELD